MTQKGGWGQGCGALSAHTPTRHKDPLQALCPACRKESPQTVDGAAGVWPPLLPFLFLKKKKKGNKNDHQECWSEHAGNKPQDDAGGDDKYTHQKATPVVSSSSRPTTWNTLPAYFLLSC